MKKLKELYKSERPREKLLGKGAVNQSDEELLAVILGKGTRNIDVLSLAKKIVTAIDDNGIEIS